MSQDELQICYIHGEDNTVADALSHLPLYSLIITALAPHVFWHSGITGTMSISTDASVLSSIKKGGYNTDLFCQQLSKINTPGTRCVDSL